MDENRTQAYLDLIQQLLDCPNGAETQILQANSELLDGEFLQACEQVATMLAEQGQENQAGFLRNLASQLREFLGMRENDNSDAGAPAERLNFLIQLLRTVSDSQGNPQQVYPFLQQNLDQLDLQLAEILTAWATDTFAKVEATQVNGIAAVIGNLANLICQFPLGSRWVNLEIAIACYEIVATVFNRSSFLEYWAAMQNNLGFAYSNRIRGERADNLEQGIACYHRALEVRTRDAFPEQWAETQNNLGLAYCDRISGARADNLEQGIACYHRALEVYTREAFPENWAVMQNNLGLAYSNRIRGARADNLEQAIACVHRALEVYTRKAFPEQWAMAQNNLATAYSDRIRGARTDNLEQGIACYQNALEVNTRDAFPQDWAGIQNNLANAYSKRIRGERADNLENAIACYQSALEVYTRDAFSEQWAMAQNNLANAYKDRIRGERADNLEQAIACYQNALEVNTRDAFPQDWAGTQNNLANAYKDRIRGERADNLEEAIACVHRALEVYTRKAFPEQWAMTQNNLANTYKGRIRGARADNLENAIACYQSALEVHTRDAFPQDWAGTQNNLAAAYSNRIRGERADNLENAIACYHRALEVRTREAFPENWATTQNNLANAYSNRIRGARADNLENAIACYQSALEVHTRDAFPQDWAGTQNNLAAAYSNRIRGERADNLENAIACYHRALEVRTREAFPEQWAMTQNNLANAYCKRIRGKRADNLENAIACYHRALEVRIRNAFPQDWADTQNNLANAYSDRIRGERADNLEQAIKLYRQALEIRTPAAFPLDCLQTGRNLGNVAFELQDWENAIYGYENAISAVEQSRDWAGTEAAKQEIQENAIEVYFQMLQACINAKNLPKAVETVERSKARNLVELLATRDLYPKGDIPQEILDQLDDLRRKIPAMQRQLGQKTPNQSSSQTDDTEKQLRRELTALQQQLDSVLAEIKKVDPEFNLTQRVKVIPYSEIQSLAANNTAIIEWYITKDKFLAFIISPNSPTPIVWQSSTADFNNLENWGSEYLADYRHNNSQWQQNLTDNLQRLAAILHLDELLNLIPPTCHQLVLIPHSYLHLFPLHALPSQRQKINPENSQLDTATGYLLDLFPKGVSYAPSCQLLQLAKKRHRPNFSHLFAIANPTKDRYLLELQAANIRQGFQSDSFWQRDNANKQAILNQQLNLANCAHFGCHGEFKPDAPLESSLKLANGDRLTLLEILALDLSQCRLVTLSACETGLTESSTTDEYIGLPFGFLLAGSPSMVSSLWKVDQLASTLLLMRFYENLKTLSTVTALNEAQQWLRNLTSEQLQALLKDLQPQIDQILEQLPLKERTRYVNAPLNGALNRKPFPFAEPHYWAAFTAIGV